MYYTARQLDDLHRSNGGNGQIVLPYRARLTPLATDWLKSRGIKVGYSDVDPKTAANKKEDAPAKPAESASTGAFLWWCDGPCGPAKAALTMHAKESPLRPMDIPADARQLVPIVKLLATEVKAGKAAGGILLVQNAALAAVFANRCPSLRAVTGTCMEAVEQGVKLVAANVLLIEYPYKTLPQIRNLLAKFLKTPRELTEDVKRQLQELSTCS
jgi:hypothetical protein